MLLREKKKIHSEMIIHEVFVNASEFSLEAEGRLLERTSPQLVLSFPVFLSLSLFFPPCIMILQHIQIEALKMLINRTWMGPF